METPSGKYLSLEEVRSRAIGRKGRRPDLATMYRWIKAGVSGVRLRTIMIGGSRATTEEWLNDFFEGITKARQARYGQPAQEIEPEAGTLSPAHQRASEEADRKLAAALLPKNTRRQTVAK